VDNRRTGLRRQVLEHIAQGLDQAIVQGIAFGRAAKAHHGHCALHFQSNTLRGCTFKEGVAGGGHAARSQVNGGKAKKVIIDNDIVISAGAFPPWCFP
jgi:hypothetical protein